MKCTRVLLSSDPLIDRSDFHHEDSPWPAKWIGHPEHPVGREPVVIAYRRRFNVDQPMKLRLHVSADERYELFIDAARVGRGPERGDRLNWFYQTYEVELDAGEHMIVARTWWLGPELSQYAQISVRAAFFLMGEDAGVVASATRSSKPRDPKTRESYSAAHDGVLHTENTSPATAPAQMRVHELISTGVATWECKLLGEYSFDKPQVGNAFLVSGAKVRIDARSFDWNFQHGQGEGWISAREVSKASIASLVAESPAQWLLRPATLPPMLDRPVHTGEARFSGPGTTLDNRVIAISSNEHESEDAARWTKLLHDEASLTIAPKTIRRIIIDLGDYYCAFPELTVTGGAGATVRIFWAESLYEDFAGHVKGNRDAIEGKFFHGIGDTFTCDGGTHRTFSTLWWEAGRYVEIVVKTEDQPLTIESLLFRETHYPHKFESEFASSDPRLEEVTPIALRTLQMCTHETYLDCPYYEQLMYVGDTRLQMLVTYVTTRDDSLPRKAIETFDYSRANSPCAGLTMARYPTRILQTIPPFSLFWIGMLHDYMMWRDDAAFVRARMPGVRAVLDAFRLHLTKDDLIESPPGWNFVDWVPGWFHGMPPSANTGNINGTLNWHFAYTLLRAADLERFVCEHDLARRNVKTATEVSVACDAFFDERRGLFAEDLAKTAFSEHTQCLALLSEPLCALHRPRVGEHLLVEPGMAQTTIYFSHYLFETYRLLGRADLILKRMSLWFDLKARGCRTTLEMPEPTRSDCHAWGAHPVYHYFASILGIRPDAPGFKRVRIEPRLGGLKHVKGSMVHPSGEIAVDVEDRDGKLTGEVRLPPGVAATLSVNNKTIELPAQPQDACFMPHPF